MLEAFPSLSVEEQARRVRELFQYDPQTGHFRWMVPLNNSSKNRVRAGKKCRDGYLRIIIGGKLYAAHRLAWLYMTGAWPMSEIDHKNLVKDDNSWRNLREATRKQNCMNLPRWSGSSAPLKGISRAQTKSGDGWRAQIQVDRKQVYIGTFPTPEAAHAAYLDAAKRYFGEFSCAGD